MTDVFQTLTEKEKQALRLLLCGHDAKSMAMQLGLSVHTVNERLREARRKLSVSSSKTAARLLHEAEAPHLIGDKALGDVALAGGVQFLDPGLALSPRRSAWTIGGFAMIALLVAALAALSADPAAPPVASAAPTAGIAESDATRAARDWLALVDAQNWQASWAATAAHFRVVNSVANWRAAAQQVHALLGPALSRELLSDFDTPSSNDVRAVRFRTIFPNNQMKIETLSLNREGGQWRVAGIYVQ